MSIGTGTPMGLGGGGGGGGRRTSMMILLVVVVIGIAIALVRGDERRDRHRD